MQVKGLSVTTGLQRREDTTSLLEKIVRLIAERLEKGNFMKTLGFLDPRVTSRGCEICNPSDANKAGISSQATIPTIPSLLSQLGALHNLNSWKWKPATIQPASVAVPAHAQPAYIVQEVPRLNKLAPHDFLWLSAMTAAVCGFLVVPFSCTMPALVASILSRNANTQRDFNSAEKYGYVGLGLSIAAIAFGFIELTSLLLPTALFCSIGSNSCYA